MNVIERRSQKRQDKVFHSYHLDFSEQRQTLFRQHLLRFLHYPAATRNFSICSFIACDRSFCKYMKFELYAQQRFLLKKKICMSSIFFQWKTHQAVQLQRCNQCRGKKYLVLEKVSTIIIQKVLQYCSKFFGYLEKSA